MLKVGLIGIGSIGRMHLDHYITLEQEGFPLKLTSICDVDENKFKGHFFGSNLGEPSEKYDFSEYNQYLDVDEMLNNETFDYVDICVPSYLHLEVTRKVLEKGIHALCEKPMALNSDECQQMIDIAKHHDRKLMIGQCMRFWPAYEYLKETIDSGDYGKVVYANFFRGGSTPKWSHNNWMLKKETGGGSLLDMHIHDVDLVNWLFGKPDKVSTVANNVLPESGYDIVSSHFSYPDNKVVNAQCDWTLKGRHGFRMSYRVNFEKATLVLQDKELNVYPDDEKGFTVPLSDRTGHFYELKYFANSIINGTPITVATPESTRESILIAEAEIESADRGGEFVPVNFEKVRVNS